MSAQEILDLEEEIELQDAELIVCNFFMEVSQRGRTDRDRESFEYHSEQCAVHRQKKSESVAALAALKNP